MLATLGAHVFTPSTFDFIREVGMDTPIAGVGALKTFRARTFGAWLFTPIGREVASAPTDEVLEVNPKYIAYTYGRHYTASYEE